LRIQKRRVTSGTLLVAGWLVAFKFSSPALARALDATAPLIGEEGPGICLTTGF